MGPTWASLVNPLAPTLPPQAKYSTRESAQSSFTCRAWSYYIPKYRAKEVVRSLPGLIQSREQEGVSL